MTDLWTMLMPAAGPLIWLFLSFMALLKLVRYRNRRLLRCPETGGVAIVDIEETLSERGAAGRPHLRVKTCQLWPEKKDCGRGCLSRCSGSWGSYEFDLASLRPFEEHEPKQHISLPHQSGSRTTHFAWKD